MTEVTAVGNLSAEGGRLAEKGRGLPDGALDFRCREARGTTEYRSEAGQGECG